MLYKADIKKILEDVALGRHIDNDDYIEDFVDRGCKYNVKYVTKIEGGKAEIYEITNDFGLSYRRHIMLYNGDEKYLSIVYLCQYYGWGYEYALIKNKLNPVDTGPSVKNLLDHLQNNNLLEAKDVCRECGHVYYIKGIIGDN